LNGVHEDPALSGDTGFLASSLVTLDRSQTVVPAGQDSCINHSQGALEMIEIVRRVLKREGARGAPSAFTLAFALLAIVVSVGWLLISAFTIGWDTQFGDDRFWLPYLVLWEIPILVPLGWFACLWGTPATRWFSLGCAVALIAIALRVATPFAIGQGGSSPDLSGGAYILGLAAIPAWFLLGGLGLMWRDRINARRQRGE
jgi:hypothetical protein